MKMAIIGAGIGGLTLAMLLEKKGISAQVFEQANEFIDKGAGIVLAHNAMQVFKHCDLLEPIVHSGNSVASFNITTSQLDPISKIDMKYFDEKYACRNIALHRAQLQSILLDNTDSRHIHFNKKLINIEKTTPYKLFFDDGSECEFDAIIAADGIHSTVRHLIFPKSSLRNTHQKCWRGVANIELPKPYASQLHEAWGVGDRFGFVPIAPKKVYWYGLHNSHKKYAKKSLDDIFSVYHPIVSKLIAHTDKSGIFESDIYDLKPISAWVDDNICLLGDAAHATTPNLGQGACQAIEDAYTLSQCLEKYSIVDAFINYQRLRYHKATKVVNLSWTVGKISQIQNPLIAALRNKLVGMTPPALNRKPLNSLYKLTDV